MATTWTADGLAQALRAAVREQRLDTTPDRAQGGAPVGVHPSVDLAVVLFPPGEAPVAANVLFSREHPQGLLARFAADHGPVTQVAFHADLRDAAGVSVAWQPGADWSTLPFVPWFGEGPRFVSPYPASLLKLMVAVGVARLVDSARSDWALPWMHAGQTRAVADWLFDMITVSSNEATSALVAHLHARGALRREGPRDGGREVHNELHTLFEAHRLPGLRLANTQPDGGWGNAAGAGVGQLQMTAWDALRLVWALDADAPALASPAGPLVSAGSRAVIRRALDAQRLNEILSSESLRAVPGWVPGIPSRYAHKTGNTENYSSDAGIVHDGPLHYLIALTSNLGQRYAPHPQAATTWKLPALGAAVHALLQRGL